MGQKYLGGASSKTDKTLGLATRRKKRKRDVPVRYLYLKASFNLFDSVLPPENLRKHVKNRCMTT